jgi:FAD:protein FMN transferase
MTAMTEPAAAAGQPAGEWRRVDTGDGAVAVAQRPAIGTTARLAVWPPGHLRAAQQAVDRVVGELDLQASRFRPDSEISWIHARDGGLFLVSDGLAEVVGVALAAARWTGGLADPTVGQAVIGLGYDRDFAALQADQPGRGPAPAPAPGWRQVRLDGPMLRLPAGVRLDLGATAKGVGCDRAANAAMHAVRQASWAGRAGGVLVSLGGDIAVAGTPPRGGWPVLAADGPDPVGGAPVQQVRLPRGAIATSSVTCRRWRQAGQVMHHIVDPRTGWPADGPWWTVSVAAATCADANAAATAAIVAGPAAASWLRAAGLPARLVNRDGLVRRAGGWPAGDDEPVPVPPATRVYGGRVRFGGPR